MDEVPQHPKDVDPRLCQTRHRDNYLRDPSSTT
jgi:hypothetical protein